MPRVTHFEIPAQNPDRAVAFYREVFGWEINKWDSPVPYWLVMTGQPDTPGIDGGLYTPVEGQPTGIINVLDVDNLDAYVTKVTGNGGKIVAPKMPVPTVGWLAYAADVEGNVFGMMQMDPAAGAE
jgi:hypothetical protein